jgi:hypothetical protein
MTIIVPQCVTEWRALPNRIFADKRLSADTRGLLGFLMTRPPNWRIRPAPLARAMSMDGAKPIGAKAVRRMLRELMAAGYAVRSARQTHKASGDFDGYDWLIGLPPDVTASTDSGECDIFSAAPSGTRASGAHASS